MAKDGPIAWRVFPLEQFALRHGPARPDGRPCHRRLANRVDFAEGKNNLEIAFRESVSGCHRMRYWMESIVSGRRRKGSGESFAHHDIVSEDSHRRLVIASRGSAGLTKAGA